MEVKGSNQFISAVQDVHEDQDVPTGGSALLEQLSYEHPDYCAKSPYWDKFYSCYAADDIYKYIYQHTRESPDTYAVRLKRGYYFNYTASVVDLYVSYLFHSPIERREGEHKAELASLYENADNAGTKYTSLMQDVATNAQIFGWCGVLVDVPPINQEEVKTEYDRQTAGIRPYLAIVEPCQIKDWELDRDGNFEWVKIKIRRPQGRSWKEEENEDICNYVIWSKTDWEEYQVVGDTAKLVGGAAHSLGRVPLVIVRNVRDPRHPWMGVSAIRDLADINLAILNWSSFGDEEIANRCLNILCMERDESDAAATLSHHNILEYNTGATAPQYLTPGETPLQMIGQWIDRGKDEIYRIAKLGGSTGLLGVREATSGIAYAYEFNETNQSLSKKAESLEHAETEIHKLYLLWLNKRFDGSIIYPREFGVDDFLLEMQVLEQARATLTSETAIKQIEKKVSAKFFARESTELRRTIEGEIEKSEPAMGLGVAKTFEQVPAGQLQGADPKPSAAESSQQ